jgi:predicted transcriptional regulator
MKFEDVLTTLNIKDFAEMSDEELGEAVQQLRSIRTDVPDTKHRRRKHRSKDHLIKKLHQMAETMKKDNPALKDMELADIVKLLMAQPQMAAILEGEEAGEEGEVTDEE